MIQKPKKNKIPLLFVHIPKTGGGTINNYFENKKQKHQTRHSNLKKIKKKVLRRIFII